MYKNKKILIIIPARGGSKRIPRKNTRFLAGKPLISYAVKAALGSKYADKIIVSTDDKKTAEIARRCGAAVPFLRPPELAGDTILIVPVLQHAVNYLEKEQKFRADLVVLAQPTSPFVQSADIDAALEKMEQEGVNSCFSVCEVKQRPEWSFVLRRGKVRPLLVGVNIEENKKMQRSQNLQPVYVLNGAVYAVRTDVLMKQGILRDVKNASIVIMPQERSIDIDEPTDFKIAEMLMKEKNKKA